MAKSKFRNLTDEQIDNVASIILRDTKGLTTDELIRSLCSQHELRFLKRDFVTQQRIVKWWADKEKLQKPIGARKIKEFTVIALQRIYVHYYCFEKIGRRSNSLLRVILTQVKHIKR